MCPNFGSDSARRSLAEIVPAYQKAHGRTDGKSTLLVEYGDYVQLRNSTLIEPARPPAWPLMNNNITREDLDALIGFLQQDNPI